MWKRIRNNVIENSLTLRMWRDTMSLGVREMTFEYLEIYHSTLAKMFSAIARASKESVDNELNDEYTKQTVIAVIRAVR